ncbi:MAG: hypothetical protein LBH32_10395 [Dysgonamonadaceae bacterium]|jgi:hypothetical protein|nr:hypothetical protein [Dysgonamonadaceae bacterium]
MKNTILFLFALNLYSCLAQQTESFECIIKKNKPMWIEAWARNPLLGLKSDGWYSYSNSYSYNYTKIPEYAPFYSYSPSKQMFVDIYSRTLNINVNGNDTSIVYLEPEAEIILSDTISKKSERILYVSDGTYFDDVIWINDTSCIVLGHFIDYNSDKVFPKIMIFDIKKQQQTHYKGNANELRLDYIERKFNNY